MTLYVVELQVPANTPDIDPVKKEVYVEGGVIVWVEVHFPPGVAAKVKTALFSGHYQIFPRPFGTWLTGDGETIRAELFHVLEARSAKLTVYGKSPGSLYPHTIIWRINVLPKQIAMPWLAFSNLVEAIYNFINMLSGGRR